MNKSWNKQIRENERMVQKNKDQAREEQKQ